MPLLRERPGSEQLPLFLCCSPELLEAEVVFCKMFTLSKHTGKWSFAEQLWPESSNSHTSESRNSWRSEQREGEAVKSRNLSPSGKNKLAAHVLSCAWQTDRQTAPAPGGELQSWKVTLALFWNNSASRVTWECHQLWGTNNPRGQKRQRAVGGTCQFWIFPLIQSHLPARGLGSAPTASLGVVCLVFMLLFWQALKAESRQSRKHKFPLLLTDGSTSPPLIPMCEKHVYSLVKM